MEASIEKARLESLAEAIPISVYKFFVRRDVIGFLYHVVSSESLPHVRHIYPYKSPEQFEGDLAYLKKNYNLISYEELLSHYDRKTRLKPGAAILSFDDGFSECFSVVRPILQRHGMPCVFFITTDLIDNRTMLFRNQVSLCIEQVANADGAWRETVFSWIDRSFGREVRALEDFTRWIKSLAPEDQGIVHELCKELEVDPGTYLERHRPYLLADEIRSLSAEGFTVGAHSKSHPRLNRLSPQELEEEVAGSCQIIGRLTGNDSVPFSFPFSAYGLSRRFLEDLCARNHAVGLLFDTKGIRADRKFITSRIWADPPPPSQKEESNLPELVLRAYQDVLIAKMRQFRLLKRK